MVADKIPFPNHAIQPTDDECIWAMVCHLSVLFGGVVIPFAVLVFKGGRSSFVAFHARQAAAYQVALIGLFIVTLGTVVFLLPLFVLVGVVTAFRARSGQTVSYPIIRRFVGTHQ